MKCKTALMINRLILSLPFLGRDFKFWYYAKTKSFLKANGFKGL